MVYTLYHHRTLSISLGHSPSWMRTLMRRAAPPLALARNSLSSGVTTSARNMAGQRSLPPARRCSRGVERWEKKATDGTGAPQHQAQIFSPVKRHWSPTKRAWCKTRPVLQMMWLSTVLAAEEEDRWVCLDSMRECDSVRRDIAQVTRTVSCAHREGTWSPLSQI